MIAQGLSPVLQPFTRAGKGDVEIPAAGDMIHLMQLYAPKNPPLLARKTSTCGDKGGIGRTIR